MARVDEPDQPLNPARVYECPQHTIPGGFMNRSTKPVRWSKEHKSIEALATEVGRRAFRWSLSGDESVADAFESFLIARSTRELGVLLALAEVGETCLFDPVDFRYLVEYRGTRPQLIRQLFVFRFLKWELETGLRIVTEAGFDLEEVLEDEDDEDDDQDHKDNM
jgi:hypothetical protein